MVEMLDKLTELGSKSRTARAWVKNPITAPERHGHSLVVTGANPVPVEVTNLVHIQREDLRCTQEEADVIVVQQAVMMAQLPNIGNVIVRADDTDIFCLLGLNIFYFKK